MAHPEEERKALGKRLAQARQAAGYTLDTAVAELARRGFKISRGTIGAWETGRNLPDALWLGRMARLYENSIDQLVGHAPPATRWPFSEELRQMVLPLSDEELARAENVLRAHLGMPVQVLEHSTGGTEQLHAHVVPVSAHSGYRSSTVMGGPSVQQKRFSALEEAGRYAEDGNDGTQDRRGAHRQGGRRN